MQFDWITFGLQIVNVLVLLAILRHFLFRPVTDIIARRQAEIVAAQDAAEAAKAAAEKAEAEARAQAHLTETTRQDALTAAQAEAETQRKKLIAEARSEAARIIADGQAEAARTVDGAQTETLRRARDLAETIASRALAAMPEPATTAGFAKRLATELGTLPDSQRAALLKGDHLRLVAPAKLSDRDLDAARTALKKHGISDFGVEVDAALIAGLELKSSTGILHNSLAHDLLKISEALHDDD